MQALLISCLALALLSGAAAQGVASSLGASSAAVGAHGEAAAAQVAAELQERRQLLDIGDGRPPAWKGRWDPTYSLSYFAPAMAQNKCPDTANCSAIKGQSYPYSRIVIDPTDPDSYVPVMKVGYPAGAWAANSERPSGVLTYAYPFKSEAKDVTGSISAISASLQYDVYFPPDFDFVKGGKLPGMAGGVSNGRGCGGGADPAFCFSFRIMWRAGGKAEAYLYVPEGMQAPDFCTVYPDCSTTKAGLPCTSCNYKAGVSFGRGTFTLVPGQWGTIYMKLVLNTPNVTDGTVQIDFNGVTVLKYDKMNWRQTAAAKIEGVEIASWFGGSDATWAPPTNTYSLLRNFKLWRSDAGVASRSVTVPEPKPQSVLVEEILAGN